MASPTYVADAVTAAAFSVNSTTVQLPLAADVPAGDTVILGICDNNAQARLVGVSDSQGNAWQLCEEFTGAAYDQTYVYVAPAIATYLRAGTDHIILTLSSVGRVLGAYAQTITNLPATFAVDVAQSAYSGASGGNTLGVVGTTEFADDWAFSFLGISCSSAPTITGPAGFTLRAGGLVATGLNGYFAAADRLVTSPGTVRAVWSASANGTMVAIVVTFRNSGTSYPPAPIVQVATSGLVAQNGINAPLSLNRAPTVGNLLLAIYGGVDAGNQIGTGPAAYLSPPAGFAELAHPVNIDQANNSHCVGIGIAYRTVQPGDGRTWTFTNNLNAYGAPSSGMGAIIYELSGVSASALYYAISQYGFGSTPGTPIGESIFNAPANSVAIAALASFTTPGATAASYSSSAPASPNMTQDQVLSSNALAASLVTYRDTTDFGAITGNVTTSAATPSQQQCVQVLVVAAHTPIGGPQILQTSYYGEDSTITPYTVTLPQTPAVGNLLVALYGGMNDTNNYVEPATGFTQLTSIVSPNGKDGRTFNQAAAAYRIVQPGDGRVWKFSDYNINGGQTNYSSGAFVAEVANVAPAAPTFASAKGSGPPYGEVTKVVAPTSLLLGISSMYDSQEGNGWSSGSSATAGWHQIGSVTGTLGDSGSIAIFAARCLSGNITAQMQNTVASPEWAAIVLEIPGIVTSADNAGFFAFFTY